MAGIDSIVNNLVRTFAANPQGLEDRYATTQELFTLIAMQKLKKDKEAAQRSLQMQMQPESGTVKDQLEDELMQATKQEIASSLAPGLQQQGQMMQAQQMQKAMAGGLPTQPAPNMVNMARGGIVGYKEGELVEGRSRVGELSRARIRENLEGALRSLGIKPSEEINAELATAQTARRDTASMLGEDVARTPPQLLPLPEEVPLRTSDEVQYAELMRKPPVGTRGLNASDYLGLMQRGESPLAKASTPTPKAGLPSLVSQRVIEDPENEANVAMATETLPAMQRAAPTAPTDPRMSRYESQLARLEAEEKDKLGSLIDFLLAAGASGGTNLGATLMGGGSGLQAREQRIKAEMAQTVKNIEDLQFQRDEMQARREETAADRELRDFLARREDATRRSEGAADRAARASEFGQDLDFRRDELEQRGAEGEAERANRLDVAQMQIDEAVTRAEAAADAEYTESQRRLLADARKAMGDDPILQGRLMRIQQTYKNNPTEMDVQMQIEIDAYLEDYMAGGGGSSGNIGGMKAPAPTN